MSYASGDAAEQVVRMSLEATQVAAKITGMGAKQVAMLIYAVLKDQKRTKGKMRLASMLRTGKPLKVFAVHDKDLSTFCKEAKKYGILYCVLRDQDATDGLTDIMVRAEDDSKVNRIFERFNFANVDMADIEADIERQLHRDSDIPEPERVQQSNDEIELILDASDLGDEISPEKQTPANPTQARIGPSRQSEPSSEKGETRSDFTPANRPSVRKEMEKIREEMSAKEKPKGQQNEKPLEHFAPKKKKKPKHLKVR